ncbi:hypothetical protein O181_022897 [Austropuccinia psidii MF-1]|uniref:Uncharacterized protein n=1 Tax=Austropuccinia psidii MF-1 TaxID=1389203 RepID=A0A9Q3CIH7_9BASI|nr:hypothetical protein [Austropuccinia psidii MF-1]
MSIKEFVRQFSKEKEEFTERMKEKSNIRPKQQEPTVVVDHEDWNAAAIAQIEKWGNRKPPQISPANENIEINF